jgi:uncharacterized delta-60 repeat protein
MTPSHPASNLTRRTAIAIAAVLTAMLLVLSIGARQASAAPGQLDPKFSGDGFTELALGQSDQAADLLYSGHRRVVVDVSDGKLVLAGIGAHGDLDPGFGTNGLVTQTLPGGVIGASGAVDSRGRLLIAVDAGTVDTNQGYLLRFSHNGQLDPKFGRGGVISVPNQSLDQVAVSPDGRIVTAGNASTTPGPGNSYAQRQLTFHRWTDRGAPDTSFGIGGVLSIPTVTCLPDSTNGCHGENWRLEGLGVQSNGAIVASAQVDTTGCCHLTSFDGLALVAANGSNYSLKTSVFKVTTPHSGALALQPDGKILISGSGLNFSSHGTDPLVARLLPDGTLDPTFGNGGVAFAHTGTTGAFGADVKVDDRGRIYLLGSTNGVEPGTRRETNAVLVARLRPSGQLDPRFGNGGVVRTPYVMTDGRILYLSSTNLIIDARGRPVVAATLGSEIALFRYLAGK